MSLTNPNKVVTEERLSDFYQGILPYLGGLAEAGFTPVGTIISVMGNSAPANYLACNGQVVNIVDYVELANYFEQQFGNKNKFGGDGTTTFGIPDLRGEFLRGCGTNSHEDGGNGSNPGQHQGGTSIPYSATWGNKSPKQIGMLTVDGQVTDIKRADKAVLTVSGTPKWLSVNIDAETPTGSLGDELILRPTNTSVLYCIATKNIYLNPSLDYSTDEKVVGTWIDGKPLYQKTLIITTDISSAETRVSISSLNTDYVQISNGTLIRNNGASISLNAVNGEYSTATIFFICYIEATKHIYIKVGNDSNNKGASAYITVQYTKTTD